MADERAQAKGEAIGAEPFECWRCGGALPFALFPLTRLARCPACRADLRACRLCRFHDRSRLNQCAHERADPPADRTLANYCTHFRPRRHAHARGDGRSLEAERQLADLFGGTSPEAGSAAADDAALAASLGLSEPAPPGEDDEARRAREALDALFDQPSSSRKE